MSPIRELERALLGRRPRQAWRWAPGTRRAATAAVVREGPGGLEVLLCQRAPRAGDPWSGHISLPGGLLAPQDADLLLCAVRETREEVGLDLRRAGRYLGALDELPALDHRGRRPLRIAPFVFALDGPARLRVGAEVASTFWMPLEPPPGVEWVRMRGVATPWRGWRHGEHLVWGLTYRTLGHLRLLAGGCSARS